MAIGFSNAPNDKPKIIFDGDKRILANHINFYLMDGEDIFIESRTKPISNVPKIRVGNQFTDDGNLIIEANDYDDFIKREPNAQKYIRKLIGAEEFLYNKKRYCLWLVDCSPNELRKMPLVMKRIDAVREFRLKSTFAPTRAMAKTPSLPREQFNPETFIVIPRITSEQRQYIPMGFMTGEYICTDRISLIPNAAVYHFGVLTSMVHMAWMRAVAGRLEMRYSYSASIVYNNFVWCTPTEKQRQRIEVTAQMILDARKLYPDASLADLYDERTMPVELRKAHQANDRAVMQAYGFDADMSEAEIVAELMRLYLKLTR